MNAPSTQRSETANLSPKEGRLRQVWRRLRGSRSPLQTGLSLGLGVFIGCQPLYGLHLALCLLLCLPLRLDVVLAYLGANISNPILAPALLISEVQLGALILEGEFRSFDWHAAQQGGIVGFVREAFVGAFVLGGALGILAAVVGALIAGRTARDQATEGAIRRTLARYRGAARADRFYVAAKLRSDPVTARVAALGHLGRVIDAGCGRGQFGLFLIERGLATTLHGFDIDPRKIQVAATAARKDADFELADLSDGHRFALGSADTVLLMDVLHYLPLEEQDALLERIRDSLGPSGRLVVREVAEPGRIQARLTRLGERLLVGIGYNRAKGRLEFRSAERILERIQALGFSARIEDSSFGTPFQNRLIVGVLPRNWDQASSNSLQNSSEARVSQSSAK